MSFQTATINPVTSNPFADIYKILNDLSVLRSVIGGGTDADVPSSWSSVYANTTTATAGTAPTYTLTPLPAVTAYATGLRLRVRVHAANSGAASTINVSGLGAKSIKTYALGSATTFDPVLTAGLIVDLEYDGTDFILVDPPSPNTTDRLPEGTTNLYYTAARAAAAAPVQSVAGRTGAVTLAKADVGLANALAPAVASVNVTAATRTNSALATDTDFLSATISANALVAGAAFNFEVNGLVDNGTTAGTLNLYVKINGTKVTLASITTTTTTKTNQPYTLRGTLQFPVIGASGQYSVGGQLITASPAAVTSTPFVAPTGTTGTTIDTTASATVVFGFAWTAANAANIGRVATATLEQIG